MVCGKNTVIGKYALITGIVMAAGAGNVLGAGSIFTTQTRTVSGTAFADDGLMPVSDSDSDAAVDFETFDVGASASADLPDVALGTGGATQNSSFLPGGVTATGSAFATAESFDFDGSADGSGMSRFSVDFVLPAGAGYTLQGMVSAFDDGITFLSLRDSQVEIFGATVVGPATELPVNESGRLQPGTYTLEIESSGNVFADSFLSSFSFAEFDIAFNVTLDEGVPAIGAWGMAIMVGLLLSAAVLVFNRVRHDMAHAC